MTRVPPPRTTHPRKWTRSKRYVSENMLGRTSYNDEEKNKDLEDTQRLEDFHQNATRALRIKAYIHQVNASPRLQTENERHEGDDT